MLEDPRKSTFLYTMPLRKLRSPRNGLSRVNFAAMWKTIYNTNTTLQYAVGTVIWKAYYLIWRSDQQEAINVKRFAYTMLQCCIPLPTV